MSWDLAVVAVALGTFGLVSRRLHGSIATPAIVFVTTGLVLGSEGLDVFETDVASSAVRHLAEVTLAIVLFSDASAIDTRRLRREAGTPVRLLAIGLPLTIALGVAGAVPLFGGLGIFEALALAVLLAPTDAALGATVVSDTRLPSRLRQGLSVESGLNDGVCVPLLFAAIAFAESNQTPALRGEILRDLIVELGVAAIVGAVVAIVVGSAYRTSTRRSWIEDNWAQVLPLAATATAYVAAHELGGSGFIAAFVAGLTYGRILGDRAHHTILLSEEVGNLASAVTFLVFGAAVVGPAIGEIDASTVVYAIASLTVVRMLPVALALAGSAAPPTLAFAGWFGPRGLATIVFMLTIVDESGLAGTATIVQVATVTVLVSVFAHGVTAPWLTDRYLAWSAR